MQELLGVYGGTGDRNAGEAVVSRWEGLVIDWGMPPERASLEALRLRAILATRLEDFERAESLYLGLLRGLSEDGGTNSILRLDTLNDVAALYVQTDRLLDAKEALGVRVEVLERLGADWQDELEETLLRYHRLEESLDRSEP